MQTLGLTDGIRRPSIALSHPLLDGEARIRRASWRGRDAQGVVPIPSEVSPRRRAAPVAVPAIERNGLPAPKELSRAAAARVLADPPFPRQAGPAAGQSQSRTH